MYNDCKNLLAHFSSIRDGHLRPPKNPTGNVPIELFYLESIIHTPCSYQLGVYP